MCVPKTCIFTTCICTTTTIISNCLCSDDCALTLTLMKHPDRSWRYAYLQSGLLSQTQRYEDGIEDAVVKNALRGPPAAGCPLSHSQQCRSVESDTKREDGRGDPIAVKNARLRWTWRSDCREDTRVVTVKMVVLAMARLQTTRNKKKVSQILIFDTLSDIKQHCLSSRQRHLSYYLISYGI